MANTILIDTLVRLHREGEATPSPLLTATGLRLTQAGEAIGGGVQVVTTSAASLNVGSVSSLGLALFWNKDATNYVSLGWDDTGFVESNRIPAGWIGIIPLVPTGVTYQVKADTASVNLFYQVLEA